MHAIIAIQTHRDRTTRHIEWDGTRQTLGRSSGCDIHIEQSVVSGHHLTFDTRAGEPIVLDAGSTNGTQLNGETLPPGEPRLIESGELITIGPVHIEVSWSNPDEDLEDLTAEFDRDRAQALIAPPESASDGLFASLELTTNDGDVRVYRLPDDSERLVLGSSDDADIALPTNHRSGVAAIERTQAGFELIPLGDHGLLRNTEGRPISDKAELSDGWTARLEGGPRIVFRDPLESQLQAFHRTAADDTETAPTPEPSAAEVTKEPTETPPPEAGSSTPGARADSAHPAGREKLLIGALVLLLIGVLFLVALFFGLIH